MGSIEKIKEEDGEGASAAAAGKKKVVVGRKKMVLATPPDIRSRRSATGSATARHRLFLATCYFRSLAVACARTTLHFTHVSDALR